MCHTNDKITDVLQVRERGLSEKQKRQGLNRVAASDPLLLIRFCRCCFQKMIVEGFLGFPVLSSHDSRLIGFVDLLDIAWFMIHSFGVWRGEQGNESMIESKVRVTGSSRESKGSRAEGG